MSKNARLCSISVCDKKHFSSGMCRQHYNKSVRTPTRHSYESMLTRCYNPNFKHYENYGGRGIKVCNRWLGEDGYKYFLLDMGERPLNYTLDRIDVNGDYTPNNCRWATRSEQSNNRNNNIYIEHKGESHTIAEWSKLMGFPRWTIGARLKDGWSVESAIETPIRHKSRRIK